MCQIMMCGAAAKESKAFREEVFIELQHWACVSPRIIFFFTQMFSIEFQHQGWVQMARLRALPNLPSALLQVSQGTAKGAGTSASVQVPSSCSCWLLH